MTRRTLDALSAAAGLAVLVTVGANAQSRRQSPTYPVASVVASQAKPAPAEPPLEKPTATSKPAAQKPATQKPATQKPETRKPATQKPAAAATPFPAEPPKAGVPRDFRVPEPRRFTLANGLQVALVQSGTMPKVRVTLSMRTGNAFEQA